MRDIKFRGKAKDIERLNEFNEYNEFGIPHQNGWVFGACVHNGGNPYIISHDVAESCEEYFSPEWWCPVDPATVGQFTGLKDKSGREIYEGDVVKYGDTIHEVVFEQRNNTAYFGLVYSPEETRSFGHYQDLQQIEIIGNVHDSPELLEEAW